jgi:hypothetical protein
MVIIPLVGKIVIFFFPTLILTRSIFTGIMIYASASCFVVIKSSTTVTIIITLILDTKGFLITIGFAHACAHCIAVVDLNAPRFANFTIVSFVTFVAITCVTHAGSGVIYTLSIHSRVDIFTSAILHSIFVAVFMLTTLSSILSFPHVTSLKTRRTITVPVATVRTRVFFVVVARAVNVNVITIMRLCSIITAFGVCGTRINVSTSLTERFFDCMIAARAIASEIQ